MIILIGHDRFVQVFGSVPAGDDSLLVQIVANAVREGFHIVLCAPGTATPVCTLPANKAKVEHDCGTAHVLSLESLLGPALPFQGENGEAGYEPKERAKVRAKVQAIINRVIKAHEGAKPNIGVIPGPSGYVVLVNQTEGVTVHQRSGFSYCLDWSWYSLPDGFDPGPGLEHIMVPPSRQDGWPLELVGQTSPAPAWLLERITTE